MGNQLPENGHSSPQFLAYVYCGQTVGWIKKYYMGTKSPKGPQPPYLRSMSVVANGWIDQDSTWYVGRLRLSLGDIVLDGDRAPCPKRGTSKNWK